MCGIFGIINIDSEQPLHEQRFSEALQTLSHRGPNAQLWERVGDEALLGHTRLSIIDLSDASNQPMVAHDRYWLVYNGEIFNYLELRTELEREGVNFRTSGDVEVLLNAYIHWGENCVQRFNGMWSFAIYDRQERSLFCSRDRYGEKPFNYAIRDGQFQFASEIKAILAYSPQLAVPNYNVIANYCRTSTGAQHAETWFQNIVRLQPGHNLAIRQGKVTITRYWHYPPARRDFVDFEGARQEYSRLFRDAVKVRMRSDVPLGVTLSAGLDSSSITYAMQDTDAAPHHCFTSRFLPAEGLVQDKSIYVDADREIDESVSARKVADELGLNSHVVDTNYTKFVTPLSKIIWHLESGNSSPAVFPLMQLLHTARKHVTVLLEGQGADELLGGYVSTILWQSVLDSIASRNWAAARTSLSEYVKTYRLSHSILMGLRVASNALPVASRIRQRLIGAEQAYGPLLRISRHIKDYPDLPKSGREGWVANTLRHQHSGGLVNLLHYGDAISMANSIESRMPFLDHRLVEFAWSLPTDFKIKLGIGKYIHREAMRGLVPDWIIDNRVKFGFNTPIATQFRKSFDEDHDPVEILLSDRCIQRGIFDRRGLTALIDAHRSGKRDHGPLLFRMLSAELWFRTFIDTKPIT